VTERALADRDVPAKAGSLGVLDRAPCGYIAFHDDGTVIAANSTLGELLDVDAEGLVGRSIEEILTVPARIFYQTHFFPLIKLHGRAEEIYFTLRPRSGAQVHVLVNAVRHEVDGSPRIDCVMLRIHERQKYEQELLQAKKAAEHANAAKMRLLSMVSHDLRTPLGAISGYADILLLGARGGVTDPQARDLRRIKDVSHYLLGLLDDILTFARAEAGALTVSIETVPVETALSQAESIVMAQFQQASISYRREPTHPGLAVCADRDRLQQILLNILGNASKFTPAGGTVTVRTSTDRDCIRIAIADTGRGIPAEMLSQVFEPFVQVDRSTDPKRQKGMGLGLAISRELARAMKGDITVESTIGSGSTFTVSLPACSSS
jgi:PAS domain S-box-containing protein